MIETALGWAVIHSVWQGSLSGLLVLSVVAATRDPRIRYGAGAGGILALLAAFFITFVLYLPRHQQLPGGMPGVWSGTVAFSASGEAAAGYSGHALALAAPWLSWIWLAGVCVSHLWQLAGLWTVSSLVRRANWPAGALWRTRLNALGTRLGVQRTVSLLESALVSTPVVIGHLRPVILVPAGVLSGLPVAQVEAVLLHELAHIRRSDYLINVFQRWVEGLFFYHPAVWWMSATVRRERENCCDDIAAAHCAGDGYEYAQALAALEQHRVLQPALGASGGSLQRRIERLVRRDPRSGPGSVLSCVTIVATTAALAFAGWESQQQPAPGPPSSPAAPRPPQATAVGPVQASAVDEHQGAWNKWLQQDVVYIIEPAERVVFERLQSDRERQNIVEQFWARRNALAGSTGLSVRDEHYRRIDFANDRLSGTAPGWATDRGRIYIVLGPPSAIESHAVAQNGRPAFEIWKYDAIANARAAQSFTFVDEKNSGDYVLQSPQSPASLAVTNRMARWVVADSMGRFVTGLELEHFELRDSDGIQTLTYFQPPGHPTAVAVVSSSALPDLADIPVGALTQTPSVTEAVQQLQTTQAARKILVIVRGSTGNGGNVIPGGILAMTVDRSLVRSSVIESLNQYVGGYRSSSDSTPEIAVHSPPGLPPLRAIALR